VRADTEQAKAHERAAIMGPRIPSSLRDEAAASGTYDRLVFCEDFIGANAATTVEPMDVQPGEYNYLTGSDPKGWHQPACMAT